MNYNIFPTQRFIKEIKRLTKKYPSLKDEFVSLVETLKENPSTGTFIGNNCYKIRLSIASKGKGKRGGARVITYLYLQAETIYLLLVYDKSEMEDIKNSELRKIIQELNLEP